MNSYRRGFIPAASALLLLFAAPVAAQDISSATSIYRLDAGSSYQTGCFEPCRCPLYEELAVRGTFVLTPDGSDPLYTYYQVNDVNWIVSPGESELRVTGTGKYQVGGEFALMHRLVLDLQVGDQPVERYDSGFVRASVFPAIQVTVSIHGLYCLDTVFVVNASPVPRSEIHPYHLTKHSTFQRGCVGFCDCLAGETLPLRGSFALVPLGDVSLREFKEFAVVNARWQVHTDNTTSGKIPIRGFGIYRALSEFVVQQQLQLDLEVGDEPRAVYDSGSVVATVPFPRLNARIASGDPQCFLTVMDVDARPRRSRRGLSRLR